MATIEERAWEKYPEVIKHHNLAQIDINEEKRRMYIEIATEQKAIDEEFYTSEMLRVENGHRISLVQLAAKILDGLGAGLPSCIYESMEKKTLEEIAEIVVNRIKEKKL